MSWIDQIGYLVLHGMTFLAKVILFIIVPFMFWRYGGFLPWPWLKGRWRQFLSGASDEELERQIKRLDYGPGQRGDEYDLVLDIKAELRKRRSEELKRQQRSKPPED